MQSHPIQQLLHTKQIHKNMQPKQMMMKLKEKEKRNLPNNMQLIELACESGQFSSKITFFIINLTHFFS